MLPEVQDDLLSLCGVQSQVGRCKPHGKLHDLLSVG